MGHFVWRIPGRCLLSGYINKRDANQGTCTNACRWSYNTYKAEENETGDIVPTQPVAQAINSPEVFVPTQATQEDAIQTINLNGDVVMGDDYVQQPSDEVVLIEEQGRPGELMAMFEDEHGTYIMNSKDLRAVELVPELTHMGVHSLKIEGRTKSHYYVARTAQVYRQAIDDAAAGKPFDTGLITALDGLANRGYTEGFLRRHVHSEYQNYENGSSSFDHQQYCGEILERNGDYLKVDVKNRFVVGDVLELMTTSGNITFKLTEILDKKGNPILEAKGSGHVVEIPVPADVDMRYALLIRNLPHSSADISAPALAYVAS